MRALDLSGHYQRRVEIDTCAHCCLVWFDDTESVRLAGPGIAELVREIHGAMQAGGEHAHAVSLARVQACPVCKAALKPVTDMTRFGRTVHLQCPNRHGYYQTYILYLAEKGFVRPLAWSDIRTMLAEGKEIFCASCGCPLPARPHDECPACRSAIGIIDPTRLASAIAPQAEAPAWAEPLTPVAAVQQHKCHACGGAVDLTRDIHCPHCHAPVRRTDTADAVAAASAAVEAANAPEARQAMQRANLAAAQYAMVDFARERSENRLQTIEKRLAIGLVLGAIVLGLVAWLRQPSQREDWSPRAAPLMAYSAQFRQPAMECDPQAAVRREARVRQLVLNPGDGGPGPASATLGAMRAAHTRAIAMRQQWESSGAYELLADPASNPFVTPQSAPAGMFRRGEAAPVVERAAFCLALNEISPPLLAEDGFHLIQVVEAR
ncbi:peptidylprolyl isomerase [Pseudoduganella sp.]|uniref:peptidylprolyl isomerase n=1 Tax=Pseudoduganella sp. TaxID=1880898 RepID=UPI0035B4A9DB